MQSEDKKCKDRVQNMSHILESNEQNQCDLHYTRVA